MHVICKNIRICTVSKELVLLFLCLLQYCESIGKGLTFLYLGSISMNGEGRVRSNNQKKKKWFGEIRGAVRFALSAVHAYMLPMPMDS